MIRSLRESWIWRKILVGIMSHWGRNDRNHEYQDSNDSASTPEINWSLSMRLCRNKRNIWHLFMISYSVMSSLFSAINWTKKFWQTLLFYLSHEIKLRGQDNSFFESSRFKYTNQRHATIFFSVKKKKKKLFERARQKRKAKKSWITVSFVKDIRSFSAILRTIFGIFFSHFITKILRRSHSLKSANESMATSCSRTFDRIHPPVANSFGWDDWSHVNFRDDKSSPET